MAASAKTQQDLFEEISRQVTGLKDRGVNTRAEAAVLRDLAAAFRHAVGGPQPGAVTASD